MTQNFAETINITTLFKSLTKPLVTPEGKVDFAIAIEAPDLMRQLLSQPAETTKFLDRLADSGDDGFTLVVDFLSKPNVINELANRYDYFQAVMKIIQKATPEQQAKMLTANQAIYGLVMGLSCGGGQPDKAEPLMQLIREATPERQVRMINAELAFFGLQKCGQEIAVSAVMESDAYKAADQGQQGTATPPPVAQLA